MNFVFSTNFRQNKSKIPVASTLSIQTLGNNRNSRVTTRTITQKTAHSQWYIHIGKINRHTRRATTNQRVNQLIVTHIKNPSKLSVYRIFHKHTHITWYPNAHTWFQHNQHECKPGSRGRGKAIAARLIGPSPARLSPIKSQSLAHTAAARKYLPLPPLSPARPRATLLLPPLSAAAVDLSVHLFKYRRTFQVEIGNDVNGIFGTSVFVVLWFVEGGWWEKGRYVFWIVIMCFVCNDILMRKKLLVCIILLSQQCHANPYFNWQCEFQWNNFL